MKWAAHKDSQGEFTHATSDCGHYSVCIIGPKDARKYEAWLIGTRNWPAKQLACDLNFAKEAQQICEDHSRQQRAA